MHFEIVHRIDASLEAVERLMGEAALAEALAAALPSIQAVEPVCSERSAEGLERRWRFVARAPLGLLRHLASAQRWLMWEEHFSYQRSTREAHWQVYPRGQDAPDAPWRRYFSSTGSYRLLPLGPRHTERRVAGDLRVGLRGLGRLIERAALGELRRAYQAEAEALHQLGRAQ